MTTRWNDSPPLEITGSRQFPAWLAEIGISLAFTTYQSHRLLLLGLTKLRAARAGSNR